ncbi:hypothetical protein EII22_04730 [Coriobacteriales bacterium OH1046]|nr:hypothetical protein EII22_04730 [Coriobacteriales bacterium OH1046]
MPSVLTHDFFGRDAYGSVALELGFTTTGEMDAFLLGNQGPDPLFYLAGNPFFDPRSRVGERMHDEKPATLFYALRASLDGMEGPEYRHARAYLAGFLCHYLLDRRSHPLVFAQQHALCASGTAGLTWALGSTIHANIERELDEMMLFRKRSCTIAEYNPADEVLCADDAVLAAIDGLYGRALPAVLGREPAAGTFSMAVRLFRLANRLFRSPRGAKRTVIGTLERLATRSPLSFYCAMSHRARPTLTTRLDNHEHGVWRHPFLPTTSTDSFLDLYGTAREEVLPAERALFSASFSPDDARALTCGLNFSGKPVGED